MYDGRISSGGSAGMEQASSFVHPDPSFRDSLEERAERIAAQVNLVEAKILVLADSLGTSMEGKPDNKKEEKEAQPSYGLLPRMSSFFYHLEDRLQAIVAHLEDVQKRVG